MAVTKRRRKVAPEPDELLEEDFALYQVDLRLRVAQYALLPSAAGLSSQAIALALTSMDARVRRNVTDWCKAAGVSRDTYYQWHRDVRWIGFRREIFDREYSDCLPDATRTMKELLRSGDIKALRLFHELRGDLIQKSEVRRVPADETPDERARRRQLQRRADEAVSHEPPDPEH